MTGVSLGRGDAGEVIGVMTMPFMLNPGVISCGANPGSPVTPDYPSPSKFTGTLHQVTIDVSGDLILDAEAELRAHMARQ